MWRTILLGTLVLVAPTLASAVATDERVEREIELVESRRFAGVHYEFLRINAPDSISSGDRKEVVTRLIPAATREIISR